MVDRGGRGLVVIHRAAHSAACSDPTVADLASRAPDLCVLSADLPRHGAAPGDLRTLTVDQCVDAGVAKIERARLDEVVLRGPVRWPWSTPRRAWFRADGVGG